ncbi:MAG: hypothetical protein FJ315_01890 [SAR202 cluster bacterium]|nr:hypothetical protein [SAR202 cluster bacterium]
MTIAVSAGKHGLKVGTPGIKSVGPLAFGPDGILFVADNVEAAIFAIDVGDAAPAGDARPLDVENLDTRLAAYLGCSRDDVNIRDMAVHPTSRNVYLSVMRGSGAAAVPVLAKVGADGKVSEVSLENVRFSQTTVEDAPAEDDSRLEVRVLADGSREGEAIEPRPGFRLRIARDRLRTVTVTDMAYVDGFLLVAGASNEEFASTLRRVPFPFGGKAAANSLEIFHVSHGRYETASPIRKFVPYAGNSSILASYTCTPVVHFSLSEATPGAHVKGRTVAELGAGNTPLDMVSYERDGQEYLLVSNARHPLFKIACKDIDRQGALTQPKEPVGVPRTALPQKGVSRMARLNDSHVLMMQQDEAGNVSLRSYSTARL